MWKDRFRVLVVLLGLCFIATSINGQDYITWSSLSLKKKVNKDYSFFLKPIFRHNLSESKYLNWSPDYAVIHTIDKNWSMMLLGRTWLIPNGPNRQFMFFDIKHAFSRGKLGVSNSFRIHQALDIEREDPDFLRWHSVYSLKLNKKFSPFTGIQMFYRVNAINQIQRMRYILGFSSKFTKKYALNFQYWREQSYNTASNNFNHLLVTTLTYSL